MERRAETVFVPFFRLTSFCRFLFFSFFEVTSSPTAAAAGVVSVSASFAFQYLQSKEAAETKTWTKGHKGATTRTKAFLSISERWSRNRFFFIIFLINDEWDDAIFNFISDLRLREIDFWTTTTTSWRSPTQSINQSVGRSIFIGKVLSCFFFHFERHFKLFLSCEIKVASLLYVPWMICPICNKWVKSDWILPSGGFLFFVVSIWLMLNKLVDN